MKGIDILIYEHKHIKRMLRIMRKASIDILEGRAIFYEDFTLMIDFVRNYADSHHHGKEEKYLFDKMLVELGLVAEKLIKNGMLVEHDLGRLYIQQLEESLVKVKSGEVEAKVDVIANAIGYCNLLTRHIDKEDNVVFTFALKELSSKGIEKFNVECAQYEIQAEKLQIQDKYIKILEDLEKKYLIYN
ncbi:MAG: hemerythrin domain-containing protein [Lachnospirales bacterium]